MEEYTTVLGDTWDMISKKVYGNEKMLHVLIQANPSHMETVIFSSGIKIKVSEVEVKATNKLPPWKR